MHNWAKERDARLQAKRQQQEQAQEAELKAKAVPTRSKQDFKLHDFLSRQEERHAQRQQWHAQQVQHLILLATAAVNPTHFKWNQSWQVAQATASQSAWKP